VQETLTDVASGDLGTGKEEQQGDHEFNSCHLRKGDKKTLIKTAIIPCLDIQMKQIKRND